MPRSPSSSSPPSPSSPPPLSLLISPPPSAHSSPFFVIHHLSILPPDLRPVPIFAHLEIPFRVLLACHRNSCLSLACLLACGLHALARSLACSLARLLVRSLALARSLARSLSPSVPPSLPPSLPKSSPSSLQSLPLFLLLLRILMCVIRHLPRDLSLSLSISFVVDLPLWRSRFHFQTFLWSICQSLFFSPPPQFSGLYDLLTCPTGYLKPASAATVLGSCSSAGEPCPDGLTCLCRPCVPNTGVNIFPNGSVCPAQASHCRLARFHSDCNKLVSDCFLNFYHPECASRNQL